MDKEDSKSTISVDKSKSKGIKAFFAKALQAITFLSLFAGIIVLGINWLQLQSELKSTEEDANRHETAVSILVEQRNLLATVVVADNNLDRLQSTQIALNKENATFAPDVPTIPVVSRTATYTPSPTLENTATPTPSFTPTATLTSTNTSTPTETPSPFGLVKGDELSDNRVTLKLKEIKYEQGRTRVGQMPIAPIVFGFDFTNSSGDTILVQLSQDKFRAEDNLGNELTCDFWDGVANARESLQYPLGNQQTVGIGVFCGEGKIPSSVTAYTLYVINFSSLPDSTWIANIQR